MKGPVDIYVAEIVRAVLGSQVHEARVADPTRVRRIAEHLMQCEEAQSALRAKGYGRAGSTFIELVREVPEHSLGILKKIFRRSPISAASFDQRELHDTWSAQ